MSSYNVNRELPMNHFGESLDSSPDFFLMKREYEESLVDWNEEDCGKLKQLDAKNQFLMLQVTEQSTNFETPLKENQPNNQEITYEEDVLRNNVESAKKTGNTTTVV
jgi:hypothetical protein